MLIDKESEEACAMLTHGGLSPSRHVPQSMLHADPSAMDKDIVEELVDILPKIRVYDVVIKGSTP